jgi:hypothetical protein
MRVQQPYFSCKKVSRFRTQRKGGENFTTPKRLTIYSNPISFMNSAFRFPLYRDELARQGLYKQHKAKGDRIQQLEREIEIWETLIAKLEGTNSE